MNSPRVGGLPHLLFHIEKTKRKADVGGKDTSASRKRNSSCHSFYLSLTPHKVKDRRTKDKTIVGRKNLFPLRSRFLPPFLLAQIKE